MEACDGLLALAFCSGAAACWAEQGTSWYVLHIARAEVQGSVILPRHGVVTDIGEAFITISS